MKNFLKITTALLLTVLTGSAQFLTATTPNMTAITGGNGSTAQMLLTAPAYVYTIRVVTGAAAGAGTTLAVFDTPDGGVNTNKTLGNVSVAKSASAAATTGGTQGASPLQAAAGSSAFAGISALVTTAFTTNATIAITQPKVVNIASLANSTTYTYTYDPPILVRGLGVTNNISGNGVVVDCTYTPANQ